MSQVIPGDERRHNERRSLRGIALLLRPGQPDIPVRTLDISLGGLAIVASANPKPGLSFTIRVQLPMVKKSVFTFDAEVRVMHSVFRNVDGGFKVGLRFLAIHDKDQERVTQYVKTGL